MVCERRQPVFWPVSCVLEIDVINSRSCPVHRAVIHVTKRCPSLNVRGNTFDYHRRLIDCAEGRGQLEPDRGDKAVQVGDQFGPASVGVGEDLTGILVQGRKSLSDCSLCEALFT